MVRWAAGAGVEGRSMCWTAIAAGRGEAVIEGVSVLLAVAVTVGVGVVEGVADN